MEEWQKPETITLWIVIMAAFVMLLLLFIILLTRTIIEKIVKTKIAESKAKLEHQQDLLKTTIRTQELERKRIAADLHDSLIGNLTVVKIQQGINQNTDDFTHLISDSIDIARRISHDLSPPLLEYTSLPELIKELLDPWKKSISIASVYDIRNEDAHTNDFKIQITRIIQEILTNISKYAKASVIDVHFRQTHKWTVLKIDDNGSGFKVKMNHKGLGLKNIETRVQFLKGHYRIQSGINKGTSALFLFKTL